VVEGVAQALGLSNVRAEQNRAEQLTDKYDFVISRAVTRMKPFFDWVSNKFNKNQFHDLPNGILYLKGGDLEEEMAEFGRKHKAYALSDYFEEPFFETKKVIYVKAP
jgi:16S rRNA (guanine527-N7)-methyltransferase